MLSVSMSPAVTLLKSVMRVIFISSVCCPVLFTVIVTGIDGDPNLNVV